MSISKELLKKEEKYTEIQAQLEESTKKILADYAKYKEEQELLLSSDKDESKEEKNELKEREKNSELEKLHKPTEENKDAMFCNSDVFLEQGPTSDVFEKTTSILMKNFQSEILNLKNDLTTLKIAQKADHEKYKQMQASKDKLASDIIKLNNQNNVLRNSLKEKDIECSDHKTKYEELDAKYKNVEKDYQRLKGELKTCIASDKLCKDQMQRVKQSYESLQIKSKNDQQNYKDQQAINKQVVEELEKRLREQEKLIKTLVTAIEHQQSIMGNLQRQTDLLATLNLCEVTEKNFRELLNLYMPEETKPTP